MNYQGGWLVRGALAGFVATLVMSVVMAIARLTGLLRIAAPAEITARAAGHVGVDPDVRHTPFHVAWSVAHLGYGTSLGALFPATRRVGPWLPTPISGLAFGMAVWVVSYLGLMPFLELYPWPRDDRRSRSASIMLAHVVYGLTLASVDARLRGRSRPRARGRR